MEKRTWANLQIVCVTLFMLGSSTQNSHARAGAQFGAAVDASCTDFNGSTPFSDQSCALCHTSSFGDRREPQWTWWEDGNQSGDFSLFCGSAPVPEPNAQPNAVNDSASTAEATPVTINVLANDSDANATDTLSVVSVTPARNGSATTDGSRVTYTPNAGFTGTDSFSYTVSDGSDEDHTAHGHDHAGMSDSADVTVTVSSSTPTNSPPRITSSPVTGATLGVPYRYDVQATDPDSDELMFSLDSNPAGMTIDRPSGLIEWTPSSAQIGAHGVIVRVEDTGGLSDTQSFNLIVEDAATPTVCVDDDSDLFSPGGGICGPIDCDDRDASVNPGAAEQCGDGVDNDCDLALDSADSECNGGDCLAELFDGGTIILDQARVNHSWKKVTLNPACREPVVILGPPSFNGSQPGVPRLRNVNGDSFEVRFQEWKYLDGTHATEEIAYLVLQAGRHVMDDGSVWEVGTFALGDTGKWAAQTFSQPFSGTPFLFLTVQTYNGGEPVTARARRVDADGFQGALFEEEALMNGHNTETVAYLAIHSASREGAVDVGEEDVPYAVETVSVNHRFTPILDGGYEIKLEEEKSADAETFHIAEDVDALDIDGLLFAQDVSSKGLNTVAIRSRFAVDDDDSDSDDDSDRDRDDEDDDSDKNSDSND